MHEDKPQFIQPMLTLSTAHMPSSEPDFGELRTAETEYGWLVWPLPTADDEVKPDVPAWLKPIHDYAVRENCMLIEFDNGSDEYSKIFPVYDWDNGDDTTG